MRIYISHVAHVKAKLGTACIMWGKKKEIVDTSVLSVHTKPLVKEN